MGHRPFPRRVASRALGHGRGARRVAGRALSHLLARDRAAGHPGLVDPRRRGRRGHARARPRLTSRDRHVRAARYDRGVTDPRALEVLQRVWGYPDFRGMQGEIIDAVMRGDDAIVLMPTGAGKSLCYQIPALVRDGTGIVVSPLIALMQDQVDALAEVGVRAAFLNSTQDPDARREVEGAFLAGRLDLLYLAPERLAVAGTQALLDRGRLSLFAIDEAHCVSQWGHDFRPDYLGLSSIAKRWPDVPRIALTATATVATRDEIAERLRLTDARRFVASFDRPNIQYHIVPKDQPVRQLIRLIRTEHPGDAGIVYRLSRRSVDETAEALVAAGIPASPYHAGLDARTRRANQARFLREDGVVMVATIAFGMGIDKPDVRFVAHLDLPKSVEGYYQETGRAGRDGEPATAWLTYGLQDVVQQRRMIDESEGDLTHKRNLTAHLDAMLALCETATCRRLQLLRYFGQESEPCGNCDTCLSPPETWDGTVAAQKLLSTIVRLDRERRQRYGAGQLIHILRGQDTERVRQLGHDSLATFGIGTELDEPAWRGVVRQLLALGLLATDEHGAFRVTEASAEVLRGTRQVTFRSDLAVARSRGDRRRRSSTAGATATTTELSATARDLFETLRVWRAGVAKEQDVPAYVVFPDSTLRTIAMLRPTSLDALRAISGVGDKKLQSYGTAVLGVVASAEAAA
ncbi:MAG: DNA helicase RecQ [Chloroflexi bacterium]|nr:DNA helicase RecQ [Chloroflexota bacterium]